MNLADAPSRSPLKYVTTLVSRGTVPDYSDDGPIRVIGQASNQLGDIDWSNTRLHAYSGPASRLKGHLQRHDILVNSTGTGTLGRVGYFTESPDGKACIADGHITVVRADRNHVEPRYLYYQLSSRHFYDYIYSALVVGATNQIELNRERLMGAPVYTPSLVEQRRIVDFLDAETVRIGQLLQLMNRQIEIVDQKRHAYLGEIMSPDRLSSVRLGYQVLLVTSGPRGWGEYAGDNGSLFFRSANLRRDSIAPNLSEFVRVQPPANAVAEANRSRVRRGDILIGITGANTGWVTLADESIAGANVSQHVCLIRPGRNLNPTWLAYFLTAPVVQEPLLGSQYGGTKPQLSLPDIRGIRVPVAAYEKQSLIAGEITDTLQHLHEQRELRRQQQALMGERRQALITAAVMGQFDVTTAQGG